MAGKAAWTGPQRAPTNPANPELSLALCLSGGGLRATFFHLGVIRALRERGLLRNVTHVFSVSGGSILAAHLVLNWDRYIGSDGDFDAVQDELKNFGMRDIRGRVVRRWLLSLLLPVLRLLPGHPWSRTQLLQNEYTGLFKGALLRDLSSSIVDPKPELQILSTSFTTGNLCSFSKEGFWIDNGKELKLCPTGLIPLSLAVAASSAFPPLFPPVTVTRQMINVPASDLPHDPEYLSDGGVYDNLGVEQFMRLKREGLNPDVLLLSDAGAQFNWSIGSRFSLIVSRTVRTTDILMQRVASATLSASLRLEGTKVVHFPISGRYPSNYADQGNYILDVGGERG